MPAGYAVRGAEELRQLLGPVALYPDALLAQVLTASTYPDDVIAAARWEDAGNPPAAADDQPWDSSVKGVARYPSVLHFMAVNIDWTNDLGDAFLDQQANVMATVQQLRGEALAAGTLASTAQQTVLNQDGYIQIIPTDPQYVYAPVYDPAVVYAPPPYVPGQPYPVYITYGPRVEVGDWLDYDFDWHDRTVYYGRWGRDRPWWHGSRPAGGVPLPDVRPGVYRPGQFRDVRGRPIEVQAARWTRDEHRPPPHRPAARPVAGRSSARARLPGARRRPRAQAARRRTSKSAAGPTSPARASAGRASREHIQPQPRPAPAAAQPAPSPCGARPSR